MDDGSLFEIHQISVFNDPVIVNRLCLDGALCSEGQVVDQDPHEGSHHLSRNPWAVPRTLGRDSHILETAYKNVQRNRC